jgi:electron transport complex protein RnfE
MGAGFFIGMLAMSSIREVLGSGTFLGVQLFGKSFQPWVVMALPPGGFLTLGVLLMGVKWWNDRRDRARKGAEAAKAGAKGAREAA